MFCRALEAVANKLAISSYVPTRNSTARRLLLPDVAPHYAGYVAWRGMVG